MTGHFFTGIGRLGNEKLQLIHRVWIRLAVYTDFDDLGAVVDVATNGLDDLIIRIGIQVFRINGVLPLWRFIQLTAKATDDDS